MGLGFVVVDTLAVGPAVGGEEEGHGVIFLAIRGGHFADGGAVVVHFPGEVAVAGVRWVTVVHVGHGPVPEGVELLFLVKLHGDHHAVGHAFGADVSVLDVRDVGKAAVVVCAGRDVEGLSLQVTVKKLVVGFLNFGLYFVLGVAHFGKKVGVFARGKGAFAVVEDGSGLGSLGRQDRVRARRGGASLEGGDESGGGKEKGYCYVGLGHG